MKPFDYMFYRIATLYKKCGENDAEIPATTIVTLFQSANILFVIPFLVNIKLNNWLAIIVYISICSFNGFYSFSSKKRIEFYEKWKDENKFIKRIRGISIIFYIIISTVLYIVGLGRYQGFANWKWEF